MSVLNWIFKSVATLLWPHCVTDADIPFYPCGFFFLSFFLAYSQQSQIAYLPYFHTWCGLSANLECRSEMCCTRLAENTGRKNHAKSRHLLTITQLYRAISSQLKHISTIRKKLIDQQYLLHKVSQYGEHRPTNGWDRCGSLGHSSKFQRVSSWLHYCTDVTQWKSTKLCTMFGGLLGWYTGYIFAVSCPVTEFCQVQNSPCIQVLCYPMLAALLPGM